MKVYWKGVVVVALGAVTVWFCLASPETVAGDHTGVVMSLPEEVLGLEGLLVPMSDAEREILPPDTGYARRVYRGKGGAAQVTGTIVLSANDRRSLHRPEVCLPGQGWTIESTEVIPVRMEGGEDLKVKRLRLSQISGVEGHDGEKIEAIFLYWYVGVDVTTPSTMERVLISAMDNVFRNVNHRWAYVSVMGLVTEGFGEGGLNPDETFDVLEDFVRVSAPRIHRAPVKSVAAF